jgi:DNA-directed RNA polymerase specialized sigma24 family protein
MESVNCNECCAGQSSGLQPLKGHCLAKVHCFQILAETVQRPLELFTASRLILWGYTDNREYALRAAQDLAQVTLVKFAQKYYQTGEFDPGSNPAEAGRRLLFTIAYHLALDLSRGSATIEEFLERRMASLKESPTEGSVTSGLQKKNNPRGRKLELPLETEDEEGKEKWLAHLTYEESRDLEFAHRLQLTPAKISQLTKKMNLVGKERAIFEAILAEYLNPQTEPGGKKGRVARLAKTLDLAPPVVNDALERLYRKAKELHREDRTHC